MTEALDLRLTHDRNLKEIFKVAVETTRRILNCDRVVIYSASHLPKALVLAESINPKYSSIIRKTIKDPFVEGEHLEMYCYGLPVTIDDIHKADKSQSDLEDLEKLEIKSLAIAPILVNDELLALLAAHQCSKLQTWNYKEVKLLTERANTASCALSNIVEAQKRKYFNSTKQIVENYPTPNFFPTMEQKDNSKGKENLDYTEPKTIIQKNRDKLFSEVQDKITQQLGQKDLLNTTVTEVRNLLECDRVVAYSLELDSYGSVVAESVVNGWTKALGKTIEDPCLVNQYFDKYRNGRVHFWNSLHSYKANPCYLEQLEALEVKAGLVAPILNEGQLYGLLIAHQCSAPRNWEEQEIYWITEIANQVAIMIEYTKIFTYNEQEPKQKQLADGEILSQQIEKESMWTEYFTEAIQQIRQSLKTDDILKTSVREVRRVLNCDRVLVYSMTQDNYGMIVAESVAAGWTKAEGRILEDPCFEAKYLDKYRKGRVRAWNNIYEAGMSKCHVEQLETLEVKANLVTPIISEDKLFGLLVAHQCSDIRQWQQPEIFWLTQIATQVGFALDNAHLLADAQQLCQQVERESKWTGYYTDAVQQIRQSLRTDDILKTSVREVRRIINCDRVVVYCINEDNYGLIVAESVTSGWTRAEGRIIKDPCFEAKYLDQYRNGRVRAISNIYEAGMSECYVQQLERLEVKANLVAPIIHKGQLYGLLVAHQCSNPRQWQQSEIRWIAQIAGQVGFALDNAQMLEQLEKSTKDTQEILDRAVNNISNIKATVHNVTVGFEHLSNSCQNFSQTVNSLKDLSKQIAQQSMGITRALNISQMDESRQNSIMDLSDTIFSLMQELLEATAKVEPLFGNIKTELTEKTVALDLETQQLIDGVAEFQTVRQKLDQVIALNHDISNLIEVISQSLENQIQSSTFAQDSVQELADITERVSQQSMAITKSFNQLVLLGL